MAAIAHNTLAKTGAWMQLRRLRSGMCVMAGLVLSLLPAAHTPAQGVRSALLDRIEGGQWQVLPRNDQGDRTKLCIASGHGLIQLRHMRDACRSFVVEDTPIAVTVHYECPGNGYGQTRLRVESPRLVQIDTQGVAGGTPFAFSAEGRKLGACPR